MQPARRLIVFSHVIHHVVDGKVLAHGPYVKEIDELAKESDELVVVAPVIMHTQGYLPQNNSGYAMNPRMFALPAAGGSRLKEKLLYLLYFPLIFAQILRGIFTPGTLHPRAPGSVALIALFLISILGRKKRKFAKFAGEWDSPAGLPATYRFQRYWLSKYFLFNGPVFVYTGMINPSHIIPSFTSSLTTATIPVANEIATKKQLNERLRIVFAGRLVPNKGVDILLQALSIVNGKSRDWELVVAGDGTEYLSLKGLANDLGLTDNLRWLGWCSQDTLMKELANAHIVCQPSRFSESWGKVLQEGMAFGCVPVASSLGGLKRQLHTRPELLFAPGDASHCALIIERIWNGEYNYDKLKEWCIDQSKQYSIGTLADFIWMKYHEHYSSQ